MYKENLLNIQFKEEAKRFATINPFIIDIHSHVNGAKAAKVFEEVAKLYGVGRVYTMTPIDGVAPVREVLGDLIRFIAIPKLQSPNPIWDHGEGFLPVLEQFYALGSRIVKFWAAPRGLDFSDQFGAPELLRITSPQRRIVMDEASKLNMIFMAHISDPDTWFQAKYKDSKRYGTKAEQYVPLDDLLARYTQPWILAHMGGWPEDLDFLTQLLNRHQNLYLDTSATKWMVRELSKHSEGDFSTFMKLHQGRIIFGSDIVTSDSHLNFHEGENDRATQASSQQEAFDLYASRYWSLRTLFETTYDGPSTIADSDLPMVEPNLYNELSSPQLRGKQLDLGSLQSIYFHAAHDLLSPYGQES
ncbi:MAG: amidohydrolase family protein [Bdellovibrionales bacterium]|nr:amidohydrolase family protein [Bdellovibrionales bacterium]